MVLKKITKGFSSKKEEEMDLNELMQSLDKVEEPKDVERYIKPIEYEDDASIEDVLEEVEDGNIVLFDLKIIEKNARKRAEVLSNLKKSINNLGGDIARLDEIRVLVAPKGIKIIKRIRR